MRPPQSVSPLTLHRLSIYLRCLRNVAGLGVITILGALSRYLGARRNATAPLAGGLIAVVTGLVILVLTAAAMEI